MLLLQVATEIDCICRHDNGPGACLPGDVNLIFGGEQQQLASGRLLFTLTTTDAAAQGKSCMPAGQRGGANIDAIAPLGAKQLDHRQSLQGNVNIRPGASPQGRDSTLLTQIAGDLGNGLIIITTAQQGVLGKGHL